MPRGNQCPDRYDFLKLSRPKARFVRSYGAVSGKLFAQFVAEIKTDLVLMSEQYRNKDRAARFLDLSGASSIWTGDNTRFRLVAQSRRDGFF